jgi:hypothetical protein
MKHRMLLAAVAVFLSPNLYAAEVKCFAREGHLGSPAHDIPLEVKKFPGSIQYIVTAKSQNYSFYALIDEGMNTFLPEIDSIDHKVTVRGALGQILEAPAGDYAQKYSKLTFVQNDNLVEVGCAIVK